MAYDSGFGSGFGSAPPLHDLGGEQSDPPHPHTRTWIPGIMMRRSMWLLRRRHRLQEVFLLIDAHGLLRKDKGRTNIFTSLMWLCRCSRRCLMSQNSVVLDPLQTHLINCFFFRIFLSKCSCRTRCTLQHSNCLWRSHCIRGSLLIWNQSAG